MKIFSGILFVMILSSCKLDHMIKLAQETDLQIGPNPLEVHGGIVSYEISAVLPPKMLPIGTSYQLFNEYRFGDEVVDVEVVEFDASNYPNSATTSSRKSEVIKFKYEDGMNPGGLYVFGVATDLRNGKTQQTDDLLVASGLIVTSLLSKNIVLRESELYSLQLLDKGDYEECINSLKDVESSSGLTLLGLAYLLNGELSKAKKVLIRSSGLRDVQAISYYFAAIVNARLGDKNEVQENLTQAFSMDGELIDFALNDLEFVNYEDQLNFAAK